LSVSEADFRFIDLFLASKSFQPTLKPRTKPPWKIIVEPLS